MDQNLITWLLLIASEVDTCKKFGICRTSGIQTILTSTQSILTNITVNIDAPAYWDIIGRDWD